MPRVHSGSHLSRIKFYPIDQHRKFFLKNLNDTEVRCKRVSHPLLFTSMFKELKKKNDNENHLTVISTYFLGLTQTTSSKTISRTFFGDDGRSFILLVSLPRYCHIIYRIISVIRSAKYGACE